jgi:predicted ATP-grasp superfamily ATP-dependent carboligase
MAIASASPELAARAGSVRSTIDVPAGVQAAIERRSVEMGIPAIGLWAQVPHYAATMPYPAASAALLDGLADLTGLALDSERLHEEARATRVRIDELIADNTEHQHMVRMLEAQADKAARETDGPRLSDSPLPSGDELAAELERYLRDQGT